MVRQQLEFMVEQMSDRLSNGPNNRFNFDLAGVNGHEQFHIQLENDRLSLEDGWHESAIGNLSASEESIEELMDMGADLIESLMDLSFNKLPDNIDLPDIDTVISLSTELNRGPVNFNLFIENDQLKIIEEVAATGDIIIRIKASYLPKLMQGKINLPVALITGKIKIENKGELIKLLARFGLKF